MRNVLKLLLVAAMLLAATAVAAPAAFGQGAENHETLEIRDEETQAHCPAVTMTGGGCLVHATSESTVELRKHVFGIETHLTSCNSEAWGRVNEDAEGYALHMKLTGASASAW